MSRPIKFRAWDGERMRDAFDLSSNPKYWWSENEDYPLMQYTGIKDKNGVEIFEGDVVVYEYLNLRNKKIYRKESEKKVIAWQNTQKVLGYNIAVADNYVVIGNIHQNPDLLEAAS